MYNANFKHNTEMFSDVNQVLKISDINQFLEISAISLSSESPSLDTGII